MQAAGLGAVLLAYFALAFGYLTVTPAWNNPDEPAHFNYVRHLAETGTLPVLQPGDWDAALLERLKSSNFRSPDRIETIRYEAWQPPLYYALAAPVYLGVPPEQRVRALRFLGVLLGGATLLVAYLVGRQLFRESLMALAVPTAMVGVPMFTASSAAITNDALANLLAAVLVLVALRGMGGLASPRQALVSGVAIGLGLLAKLSLIVYLPLVLAGLAHGAWYAVRSRSAVARVCLPVMSVALALWVPWLTRNGLTYGWDDPLGGRRHDAVVVDQPRFPGVVWEHFQYLVTTLFHSFWAQFGWMAFPVDERLYWTWGLVSLAAVGGLLLAFSRGSLRRPEWLIAAGSVAALLAALAAYNLVFIQAQGRYLFPALVPLAALAVLGWRELAPRAARPRAPQAVGAFLVGANAFTLVRYAAPALRGCGTVPC